MKKVEKLSQEKKTELSDFRKSSKIVIEIQRAQAILLIDAKIDSGTITMITGYRKASASALRKRYLERGLDGIKAPHREPKKLLTKSQIIEIAKLVKTTLPTDHNINSELWTTASLARLIKEKYNVVYKSRTSLYLIFKAAKFSYHKPDKIYRNRKQEVIDLWHTEVAPLIKKEMEVPGQVVLVSDEMILTTQTTTQKAWIESGKQVFVETSNKREKRCIYGFLDVKSGKQMAFKTEHTNSLNTCLVLQKLLEIYPDQKIVIVWDNAPWHKSDAVKKFLEEHPGKFHLFAFPPYCPEVNPQEHVWKFGRSNVTHNTYIEDIDKATDEFVAYLNQSLFQYKFL